jgi:hypothetical protein
MGVLISGWVRSVTIPVAWFPYLSLSLLCKPLRVRTRAQSNSMRHAQQSSIPLILGIPSPLPGGNGNSSNASG